MRIVSRTSNDDTARLSEAAQHLLLMEEGGEDPRDPDGVFRWAARDPRNLRAFRRIHAFKAWVHGLDRDTKSALERELIPRALQLPRHRRSRLRRWSYAAAAAVLFGAVGLSVMLNRDLPAANPVSREYVTSRARTRNIVLPDGTRITLAGDSSLRVAYHTRRREVTLDKGEAYFQVHHDASRPFTVHAGTLRVEDLGTAFDIRKSASEVTVSVARGRVEVHQESSGDENAGARSAQPSTTSVELDAGDQVTALRFSKALQIRPVGDARVASWRQGRLRFKDARLAAVVASLDRNSTVPISLADKRIGDQLFTGTIFVDNISDWLHAACVVFHLREEHRPNGAIVLRAAPAATHTHFTERSP